MGRFKNIWRFDHSYPQLTVNILMFILLSLKNLFLRSEACISLYQVSVCVFLDLSGLGEARFTSPWSSSGCGGECGQTRRVCLLSHITIFQQFL